MNTIISEATMGWGKVKINDPAIHFSFGKVNTRKLDERQLKHLRKSLEEEGHIWYKIENMLPLIVADPSWIDETSLTKDVTQGAKMGSLELTTEGREKMTSWKMAGGQHRVKAIEQILEAKTHDLNQLQKEKRTVSGKRGDGAKKAATIGRLEEAINAKSRELEDLQYWGVIVYNEREHNFSQVLVQSRNENAARKGDPFCASFLC